MKISVIIPLYNKEKYIQRTIESALKQETPADEILVIDDGSTDRSADIVRSIKDPRIRLIQQQNAGECAARNRGLAEARNDLVALLDADDEWKPGFLTHIQRLSNNFPDCGIYATAFNVCGPNGILPSRKHPLIPSEPWIGILPNFFETLQHKLPFFPSSVALMKEYCLKAGGFPAGVKRGGDLIMWIRMGISFPIAYSPSRQVLYHTEAENRACDVFPSLEEPAHAKEIIDLLDQGLVPADLVDQLREYYYLANIRKAKELIDFGDIKTARTLLQKAQKTHDHKKEYYLWQFLSGKIPAKFLPLVRKIKQSLNN